MALFDAARTLSVAGAALPTYGGQPILTPVRLSGSETLGELFEYTLELKTPDALAFSPSIAANIPLDRLVGTEVTVSIEIEGKGHFIPGLAGEAGQANVGAGTREITGIVSVARIVREDGRSIVYELTLRPWLWLATKNQDCRNFQDMSVLEITDEVLSAYTFPVENRLTTPRPNQVYPPRDIQRQHWESDYQFLCRLWQEWGIYYWFDHSDGKQRLVLCDSIGAHKPHDEAYRTIRYEAPTGKRIDEEHVHTLSIVNALTTGSVSSIDYDYTWPRADLFVTREDPRDTAFANQEHYTWGDYAQPQAGAAGLPGTHNEPQNEAGYLALVQMQAMRCVGLRGTGVGNLRGVVTGRTFVLTHYPQMAANREYLVVSSKIRIEDAGEATGTDQRYDCETHFEIQPTSEAFRLLRTIAKPRADGPDKAIVTGPADQEIWTDQYGRVKLQFIWDRLGQNDERSSCWVRVVSPWQGNEFGGTFLPRRGQEVTVDFINGDPDLPIVTGRAVNEFNQPAWKLPDNQALAGIRSREIGSNRSNSLTLDDTNGKIQAQISSDESLSQLNLGYITRIAGNAGRQDIRGKGFELRTDAHGVVRAGDGMLLTTEPRSNAHAHVKDMGETAERLEQAERWQATLAQLAQQGSAQDSNNHQDTVAQALAKQNSQIRGVSNTADADSFPELDAPHIVISGAAGIHTTTPASTHFASGEHLALTSGEHIAASANGSLLASAKDTIRLFAGRGGMKAVAGDGDIDIHALQKAINLLALLEVNVTSDTIHIKAKKKLVLDGGGSYIQLEQGSIKSGTSGIWLAHAAHHFFPQPHEVPVELHVPKVCTECLLKAAKNGTSVVPRM